MTDPQRNIRRPFSAMAAMMLIAMPCCATRAHAFRPFQGTDAQVSPPRALETELQPMGYERIGSERSLVLPEVVLNYGAGSGWEFALEARRVLLMNPEGPNPKPDIDEDGVVAKRVLRRGFLQGVAGPSVAAEAEFELPTTAERGAGVTAAFIVSQEWQVLTYHVNAEISDTRSHEFGRFGSVIGVLEPEGWAVHPIVELSIEREGNEATRQSILGGILWEPRPGLTLDAGIRSGYAEEHELELRSGLTWKKRVPKGPRMP